MNAAKLARIIWSHKILALTPVVCSLLGGVFVITTFPARYEATSRVMLDIIKPDPITGFRVSSRNYNAYVSSQVQIIQDEQVGGRVVEEMGWLENPDMMAAWEFAPDKGDDFRRWAARRITYATGVSLIPETNILEIKFQSTAPDLARVIADNIRTAYVETTVSGQRESARAGASGYTAQAAREQARLLQLQTLKANLERDTGVMMPDEGTDLDTQRLTGMAGAVRTPEPVALLKDYSAAPKAQLAQLDSAIANAANVLGPNNPTLVRMKQQREFLATQVAALAPRAPTGDFIMRQAEASAGIMRQQIEKVLAQGDKVLALHLVTDEIKRRRLLYRNVQQRAGDLGQLSDISDASLTPVGLTTVEPVPVFPNVPLILGGTGGLGLGAGLLLSFLAEALARRVRSIRDLQTATSVATISVIPRFEFPKEPKVRVKKVRGADPARREKPARETGAERRERKRRERNAGTVRA